jgi:hypothetical protein
MCCIITVLPLLGGATIRARWPGRWGNDVDDAAGDVLFALDVALQLHLLLGEQRREVLEHHLVLVLLGRAAVDLVELGQRKVALAVLGCAHLAFDHVAGVQVEAAHLAGLM